MILRSRSLSRSKSSSEESYSGSNHGSEFDESVPQVAEVVIVSDKHGPPVDLSKQDKFYSSRKEYWFSGGKVSASGHESYTRTASRS